jgi:hypothetical protein
MLINKDQDNDHSVKVAFAGAAAGRNRSFAGAVESVVFGPAEYQFHADRFLPAPTPLPAGVAVAAAVARSAAMRIQRTPIQIDGERSGRHLFRLPARSSCSAQAQS